MVSFHLSKIPILDSGVDQRRSTALGGFHETSGVTTQPCHCTAVFGACSAERESMTRAADWPVILLPSRPHESGPSVRVVVRPQTGGEPREERIGLCPDRWLARPGKARASPRRRQPSCALKGEEGEPDGDTILAFMCRVLPTARRPLQGRGVVGSLFRGSRSQARLTPGW